MSNCSVYDAKLIGDSKAFNIDASALAGQGEAGSAGASGFSAVALSELQTRCGDGIISGPELCDTALEAGSAGACPTACEALAPCAQRVLTGTACQAQCILIAATCGAADGCCLADCPAAHDVDCSKSCGDGQVDTSAGETCEPGTTSPCKTSDAECADDDPCTQDVLTGSAEKCNTVCTHQPITARTADDGCCPAGANLTQDSDCQPVCGNGVIETGEACDGGSGCSAECTLTLPADQESCIDSLATDACQRCSCRKCTDAYTACRNGTDPNANALCSALVACTERTMCVGPACYCGPGPICGVPRGPCQTEVENAAGTTVPLQVSILSMSTASPLGRGYAADICRAANCSDECQTPK